MEINNLLYIESFLWIEELHNKKVDGTYCVYYVIIMLRKEKKNINIPYKLFLKV